MKPEPDFPYYDGEPVEISAMRWLVPLAAVGAATYLLLVQPQVFSEGYWRLGPGLLIAILPLAGLALITREHWTALFRKVRLKEIGWMFAFALLNYAIAIPLGLISMNFIETAENPGISGMAESGVVEQILFFANSVPQLIGEELITIIPFIAIIYFLTRKIDVGRTSAIIVAWLVTAVWFASIHLPTYNWNILQCLVLIGGARLVLTLAYIKTKNIWVSAGAHIINDWATFSIALFGANRAATGV
ncbi:MAG: CPBP family intramembrane metalloprotease [Woeseiaceae bacterium]